MRRILLAGSEGAGAACGHRAACEGWEILAIGEIAESFSEGYEFIVYIEQHVHGVGGAAELVGGPVADHELIERVAFQTGEGPYPFTGKPEIDIIIFLF